MGFEHADHFSGHAGCYEEFRPTYPSALFDYLASLCRQHDRAWDCATGNGQAALPLALHFREVIATDISQKQLDLAQPSDRVRFALAPADAAPFESDGYKTLSFPFDEMPAPRFEMTHTWDLSHLFGYITSWSATQRYRARTGTDPLALVRAELESAWGDPAIERTVTWPLLLRIGRIKGTA